MFVPAIEKNYPVTFHWKQCFFVAYTRYADAPDCIIPCTFAINDADRSTTAKYPDFVGTPITASWTDRVRAPINYDISHSQPTLSQAGRSYAYNMLTTDVLQLVRGTIRTLRIVDDCGGETEVKNVRWNERMVDVLDRAGLDTKTKFGVNCERYKPNADNDDGNDENITNYEYPEEICMDPHRMLIGNFMFFSIYLAPTLKHDYDNVVWDTDVMSVYIGYDDDDDDDDDDSHSASQSDDSDSDSDSDSASQTQKEGSAVGKRTAPSSKPEAKRR